MDLKAGGTGAGEGAPPVPPPLRSRFLYRIFHVIFSKKRPVAFQWPALDSPGRFKPLREACRTGPVLTSSRMDLVVPRNDK